MSIDSARNVVAAWRRGDHLREWAPAAHATPPHKISEAYAEELRQLMYLTDKAADRLLNHHGYLPSHPSVCYFRELSSQLAREAGRVYAWAAQLSAAEAEPAEAEASPATRSPAPSPG